MAPSDGSAITIGDAVRDGLQLSAQEAVALVYEACAQLETGAATNLPTSIDELSVDTEGRVSFPPTGEPHFAQTAVAGMLDALLAIVREDAEPIPPALRSLPARLRASDAKKSTAVRDLLSILRWHLPRDSKQVLQQLIARSALAEVDNDIPLWDAPAEDVAPQSELEIERTSTAPLVPASRSRRPLTWAFAAAAVVALSMSGYVGYRYVSWPGGEDPRSQVAQATSPSNEPRITPAPARDGPHPLPLPVRGGAFSPSFAAQPRTLLFHAGRNTAGHLYTATLDDHGVPSGIRLLLDEPARNYHARLSPDGRWIAFDSDRDGERGVYVADTMGTSISRVNGDGYGAVPSWSPDMKSLAFIRAEAGRPRVWNLWIRTLATGVVSRATHYRSGQVWGASWFPDSASYAYSHEQELIIADRSGRSLATYPSPVPGRIVRTPAVSPDGRQIVFQVFREGVWVLDLGSGTMRGVLDDPSAEEFAWDPSGRRIAYHSRRDGEWRIWVLSL